MRMLPTPNRPEYAAQILGSSCRGGVPTLLAIVAATALVPALVGSGLLIVRIVHQCLHDVEQVAVDRPSLEVAGGPEITHT